mgnify:CR=1 FL=1
MVTIGCGRTVKPVTFSVLGKDGKDKAVRGTVSYIHPARRYCILEFAVRGADTIVDAAVIPKVFLSDTASTNVFAYKNLFSHPIVSSVPSSHAISQSLLDATAAAHTSGFHHQIIIQRLLITDQI